MTENCTWHIVHHAAVNVNRTVTAPDIGFGRCSSVPEATHTLFSILCSVDSKTKPKREGEAPGPTSNTGSSQQTKRFTHKTTQHIDKFFTITSKPGRHSRTPRTLHVSTLTEHRFWRAAANRRFFFRVSCNRSGVNVSPLVA
jgi:hypothetical protein